MVTDCQFESFGTTSSHDEIGPESFGIVVCLSADIVPCILGLAWRRCRSKSRSKPKMSGRILKSSPGPFSQPSHHPIGTRWENGVVRARSSKPRFDERGIDPDARDEGHYVDKSTLCNIIVLPDHKSRFRAGFRPDSNRDSLEIGPPAGRSPA